MAKQLIFSFKEKYIKAALVERSSNSYDVLTGGSIEISPGAIGAGVINNYDEVKEKLGDLIGGVSKAKSHDILILLSEEAGFLKVLEDTEKDFLKKSEAQEDIPYSLQGSFTTLRLLKNKGIQLAATPRDLIFTYQKLFREIGLEIRSIIPEPVIFLPFLEKATKPFLIISLEGGSVLFTVIYEAGVYFSTTKHFKDAIFDKNKLITWIREVVEREVKTLAPTYDFEALVFGERETEILEILKGENVIAQSLNIKLGKVNPQIGDISSFNKIVITAGLNKQIPGFHIKDVLEAKDSKKIQPPTLPRFDFRILAAIFIGIILIAGILWSAPKVLDNLSEPEEKEASTTVPISTSSAKATPSAKKEEPKKATKPAKKIEKPKPVLKKSSLKIEILNGNGVAGSASQAEEILNNKGYNVVSVGNAANYNYAKTEVRLKKSKDDYLPLLTKDLSGSYTVITGALLPENSLVDAQVIIGKK